MSDNSITRREWLGGAVALGALGATAHTAAQTKVSPPILTVSPTVAPDWATGPAAIAKAQATDPVKMGWMLGAPPPADRVIQFGDASFLFFPQTRWSFSNMRRLAPTGNIARAPLAPKPLPVALRPDIDALTFTPLQGSGFNRPISWSDSLFANFTDAIVVLHRGRVVFERSFGVTTPTTPHITFSVTKSLVGTLVASLVEERKIDPAATVKSYVPELAGSGYADATVRDVMDMVVAIQFSEDYSLPGSEINGLALAAGLVPRPPGYSGPNGLRAFLPTLVKSGTHGERFTYKTADTDVLAWIVHRATGTPIGRHIEDRYWSKLGQEADAYIKVDTVGVEFGGGGLSAGVRDLARFGEMMRLGGLWNGVQLVPRAVVDNIARGGDRAKFAKGGYKGMDGWSYRDQWWITAHGPYCALGVFGQMIWIDPKAEMVIARLASNPLADADDFHATTFPALDAVAKLLMRG